MKSRQRGHADFSFLYWIAAAAGTLLTCGGVALLVVAYKGLT